MPCCDKPSECKCCASCNDCDCCKTGKCGKSERPCCTDKCKTDGCKCEHTKQCIAACGDLAAGKKCCK